MAQAEHVESLNVGKDDLFAAITRYEDYPQFVTGVTKVEVERKGPGRARVTYHVSMMKDVVYTLDHEEDAAQGVIVWKLVKSDFFKTNNGRWEIKPEGADKCHVKYSLEADFSIPVPGFILKRMIKGNLPDMVKSFENRAKSQKNVKKA